MNKTKRILPRVAGAVLGVAMALACLPPVQLHAEGAEAPEVDAQALAASNADTYIVMDAATGQVVLGSGQEVAKYPASITKIVTLGLVQEAINNGTIAWDTNVTVSQAAMDALIPDASTAGLMAGETVSVRDLVYATQIRSANEAANVLAELLGGSIDGFAVMMNARVRELGLQNTNFTNPSGLPDRNHYTTAYDMAVLTGWAMEIPGFLDVFNAVEYVMQPTNMYNGERGFYSTNGTQLEESDYYVEGILGTKSGYTDAAAYTLVTAAERDGVRLVCVVLHCDTNEGKFVATQALLDYSFTNFTRVEFAPEATSPLQVPVYGGGEGSIGEITVHGAEGMSFLLHKDLTLEDVRIEYQVPEAYVMGDSFAPTAQLVIGDGSLQAAQGISLAMGWEGLEGIINENTRTWVARAPLRQPTDYTPLFNGLKTAGIVVLALLAALIVLASGRILFVQQRRRKRRERQLLQQRQVMVEKAAYTYRRPMVAPTSPAGRVSRGPAGNIRRPAVHLTVVKSTALVGQVPRAGQR